VESKATAGLPFESKRKTLAGEPPAAVKRALGIKAHGPEIGSVRVGEQSEFWREFEAAVAANRHTVRGAFQEFIIGGLTPAASVFGEKRVTT